MKQHFENLHLGLIDNDYACVIIITNIYTFCFWFTTHISFDYFSSLQTIYIYIYIYMKKLYIVLLNLLPQKW